MTKWKRFLFKFQPSSFWIGLYMILLAMFASSAMLAYISGQTLVAKALALCSLWPVFGLLLNAGFVRYHNRRMNE
jgi:hypothetical protein